jgi:uncharacterized protein YpmB
MNKKLFIQVLTPIATALVSSAVVYFTMSKVQEQEARAEAQENLVLNED